MPLRRSARGQSSDQFDAIGFHPCIGTRKGQTFTARLCDQHAIKRIGMMGRKYGGAFGMGPGNGQRSAARIDGDAEDLFRHVELADGAL